MDKNDKITKHIGEQTTLTQDSNQGNRSSENGDSGKGDSTTQESTPLKPQGTLKGITFPKVNKK
ncbi:MAG: hypothetical protein NC913_06320 [Candidatus Omnitrophica bacterium]|nr:hypothetical protein [Candidatus Omnitrophota bacterium]